MIHILIVDDEKNIREGLQKALEPSGYKIILASDGKEGLEKFLINKIDLAILDIKMPKINGLEVLQKINDFQTTIPIIFLTGHGNVETAVEAMRLGAYDFLTKPVNLDKLEIIIKRALNLKELEKTNKKLKNQIRDYEVVKNILGKSKQTLKLIETIKKVAPSKANVYIYGESGTGKEEVCNAIHQYTMENKPLIKVNCSALSPTLMESELFGHEKGAFTGAHQLKIGRFEAANGGSLFLDEVSEIPKEVQIKLLRVLQEKKIERIGSNQSVDLNCRIICASNKNLEEEVKKNNFREDLFYRLNVIDINVPPLRERKEDIDLLSKNFFEFFTKENNFDSLEITPQVFSCFQNYSWPGNIRELKNIVEKLVVMNTNNKIAIKDLPVYLRKNNIEKNNIDIPFGISLEEAEKKIIFETIQYFRGNKSNAAKSLKIGRKTLHRKINPQ